MSRVAGALAGLSLCVTFSARAQSAETAAPPAAATVEFVLRVQAPVAGHGCEPPGETVRLTIEDLRADVRLARRVAWVGAQAPADVRLCKRGQQLWFLEGGDTPAQALRAGANPLELRHSDDPPTPGSSLSPFAAAVLDTLERIARITNLLRIAAALPPGETAVSVAVAQCEGAKLTRCHGIEGDAARLQAGAEVRLRLTNTGPRPLDVTVLHVDAGDALTALLPAADSTPARARLKPGDRPVAVTFTPAAGTERVLVIAVPAHAGAAASSFAGLAQGGPQPAPGASTPLAQLLQEALYGSSPQRRVDPGIAATITTFRWRVLP